MRIVLFDIDGVIIRPPHYFGRELETQGFSNASDILNDFFRNENTPCTEGKADIEKLIISYLKKIGWKKNVKEFFKEQFDFEAQFFDNSFIDVVKKLQKEGILCYLASAQEKVRADYFLDTFGFNKIFDGHYISCDIGYRKDKTQYWEYVISDLQNKYQDLQLSEIVFIDDGKKNIETAKNYGIQAFLFTDKEKLLKDLVDIGIKL